MWLRKKLWSLKSPKFISVSAPEQSAPEPCKVPAFFLNEPGHGLFDPHSLGGVSRPSKISYIVLINPCATMPDLKTKVLSLKVRNRL